MRFVNTKLDRAPPFLLLKRVFFSSYWRNNCLPDGDFGALSISQLVKIVGKQFAFFFHQIRKKKFSGTGNAALAPFFKFIYLPFSSSRMT